MVASGAAEGKRVSAGKRRRRGGFAVVVVLSLALVAALAGVGYFWRTSTAWKADSAAWEEQARRQAADVALLTGQLDGVSVQLSAMEGQLGTATNRISSLADEKAQLGDENAIRQQFLEQQQAHLDLQNQITKSAAVAADRLARCTTGQSQLIDYYRSGGAANTASVNTFSRQVEQLCTEAATEVAALRVKLAASGDALAEEISAPSSPSVEISSAVPTTPAATTPAPSIDIDLTPDSPTVTLPTAQE